MTDIMITVKANLLAAITVISMTSGCKWKTGAGEGIRTLDPNLGKVVLYP